MGFFDAAWCGKVVRRDSFYGLLAGHGGRIVCDGDFAQTGTDDGQSSNHSGRGTRIVGSSSDDGSRQPEAPLLISRVTPGAEAMGPQPDPWTGRSRDDNGGGPQPDPWTPSGNGEGHKKPGSPDPNPDPTNVKLSPP